MVRPAFNTVGFGKTQAQKAAAKKKRKFRPRKHEPVIVTRVGDGPVRTGLPKSAYSRYIKSEEWRERRRRWFSRNERVCADCRRRDGIMHLHHLTYVRLGIEKDADLACLCPKCHRTRHITRK